MPIPLLHAKGGWWFDAAEGEEEILNRRIGRNEMNVVGICRAYVEAQQEFMELAQQNGEAGEYPNASAAARASMTVFTGRRRRANCRVLSAF